MATLKTSRSPGGPARYRANSINALFLPPVSVIIIWRYFLGLEELDLSRDQKGGTNDFPRNKRKNECDLQLFSILELGLNFSVKKSRGMVNDSSGGWKKQKDNARMQMLRRWSFIGFHKAERWNSWNNSAW